MELFQIFGDLDLRVILENLFQIFGDLGFTVTNMLRVIVNIRRFGFTGHFNSIALIKNGLKPLV